MNADDELAQLQRDLSDLKEHAKKLKCAESSYAAEFSAFTSNYNRLKKYFKGLDREKQKSPEGREISEILNGINRSRPIKPHWLLTFLLGNYLTYRLLTTSDRLAYKKDYESFKISVTIGHLLLSIIGIVFVSKSILFDGFVSFYSAIAYWMLIGREAVLKMNGSNIRGWWFAHHFISLSLSTVMIIWDKGDLESGYASVRPALFYFYLYIGSVQILQYRYQMSRLYALRSLSRVDPMETTNELSQNLIHHNLLFLLPFLLVAYAAEFYLAYLIWTNCCMSNCRSMCTSVLIAGLYFTLAVGNTLTTCYTYYRKIFKAESSTRSSGHEEVKKHLLIRQFTRSSEDLTSLSLFNKNNSNNKQE